MARKNPKTVQDLRSGTTVHFVYPDDSIMSVLVNKAYIDKCSNGTRRLVIDVRERTESGITNVAYILMRTVKAFSSRNKAERFVNRAKSLREAKFTKRVI